MRGWPPNDYDDLFQQGAAWQRAADHVTAFEISKRFALEATDEELSRLIASLKEKHIALSVQTTPLIGTSRCGLGVEGHGPVNDMERIATRLKSLGAEVDYLRMDEPLYYGTVFKGNGKAIGCHSAVDDMASQANVKLQPFFRAYPDVIVGDIEPFDHTIQNGQEWGREIIKWHAAFKAATGKPIAFFDADVVSETQEALKQCVAALSVIGESGAEIGIIYNGEPDAATDDSWISQAASKFELFEGNFGIVPDRAVIQSWTDWPRKVLPEDSPDTFTGLLMRYIEWKREKGDPVRKETQ